MRDAFLRDVPFHPDRQADPTFISLSEVDYNPEDIEDPETQQWDWDNV